MESHPYVLVPAIVPVLPLASSHRVFELTVTFQKLISSLFGTELSALSFIEVAVASVVYVAV